MPYVPSVGFTALTRDEPIGVISQSDLNREYELPNAGGLLPMDRYMWGLRLMWEGRITMPATGGPTAESADGRYAIIDELVVKGFHLGRGQDEEFLRLRGPDLRQLVRIYSSHEPLSTPASLNFSASATNDVRFALDVPFVPLGLPWRAQTGWLLDAPNYRDLKLRLKIGDAVSMFNTHTTAPTFSAYGSTSGSPSIYVDGTFCLGGASRFAGYRPGRVYRYYREISGSPLTTTQTAVRLYDIPTGHRIRSLLLKTGVKQTVTGGNNAFGSLSDDILKQIKVFRGLNTINRHWRTFYDMRNASVGTSSVYFVAPAQGYALIDWARLGNDAELLNAAGLVAGPSGSVDLFLQADVTGASDQALVVIIEEWRYAPIVLQPVGRRVVSRRR